MWGNDVHGDCVSAEEAFAKACNHPEIFIPESEVIAWATTHGVLEGAYLTDVLTWMQTDGFSASGSIYKDGPHSTVDWTNAGVLKSAIALGPVKIGVAADQIETAWNSTGGQSGWFATGFHADANEDHCTTLCGYGSLSWLAQQLGVQVPAGIDGTRAGYAMFTWKSIGIIDRPSLIAITHEAWLRQPTTITVANHAVDAALYSGTKCYFFHGKHYIRVTRGNTGAGTVDAGYPAPISNWGWPSGFGANGIDAALYSGSKCYFFKGNQYIRVTRGSTGAGTVDAGYPKPISNWGWPGSFGANGIDAALYSGPKCYFFKGNQYIRVTRGDTGPGIVDAGYPKPISNWGWGSFGANGIDDALYSGSKCYFFKGNQYIRVTRGSTGAGTVDAGYPAPISNWGWPDF